LLATVFRRTDWALRPEPAMSKILKDDMYEFLDAGAVTGR
jgi:hypothetical protein